MAGFIAFERNKFHQILKIASISPKRLTYTVRGVFVSFFHCFKFRWLFRYLKRNVPLVSTVPRFCVPFVRGPAIHKIGTKRSLWCKRGTFRSEFPSVNKI